MSGYPHKLTRTTDAATSERGRENGGVDVSKYVICMRLVTGIHVALQ